MARLWGRVIRVTITGKEGSTVIEGLSISFSAKKTIGSAPNEGEVTIYNLDKTTMAKLGNELDYIKVEAGYQGSEIGVIFEGSIRDVEVNQEDADIAVKITAGDGDEGIRNGVKSKTYPKGARPQDIVNDIVGDMPKVSKGESKGLDSLPVFKRPVTVYGHCSSELNKLGSQLNFFWSIQNGSFEAVTNKETIGEIIIISRETGMVGIPEVTDKGVKFKALMNPHLAPNRKVRVISAFLDEGLERDKQDTHDGGGEYRITTANIAGSNRSEDFYCECEAERFPPLNTETDGDDSDDNQGEDTNLVSDTTGV